MKGKRFRRAVEAEVERQRCFRPITFRNLTINFTNRTIEIDGRIVRTEMQSVVMPIISTERVILPGDTGGVL